MEVENLQEFNAGNLKTWKACPFEIKLFGIEVYLKHIKHTE